MEIYLVRHGETQYNTEKRFQGWSDSPLTKKGIEAAKIFGESIKDINFDAVFSSDLKRAMDTADIINNINNNVSPRHIDENLREIRLGNLEGKPINSVPRKRIEEIATELGDVDKHYIKAMDIARREVENHGDVEKNQDLYNRFLNALIGIGKKGNEKGWDKVLVIAHGFAILNLLVGLDENIKGNISIPNLMLIELKYVEEDNGIVLITDIEDING